MLRTSMHGLRKSVSKCSYRGPHGQESEEGKEDRESDQEGGKEDVAEEVATRKRCSGSKSEPK
jgi:hypothetical protein